MPAFSTCAVNPLDLQLDTQNPRFMLHDDKMNEAGIIEYLITNEDVLSLCTRLNRMGTILPGERIVVCREGGKMVVLEGNRRICCCKMLLDRACIPNAFQKRVPEILPNTYENLHEIHVDIVSSRKEAKKYLAARHISGVKGWSPIAKMNFVAQEFRGGRSVEEISEISSLPIGKIRDFLKSFSLLNAGLNADSWTPEEARKLDLLNIPADRYLRLFKTKEGHAQLPIDFDENFKPHSRVAQDDKLYRVLSLLIRAAFLDETISTRTQFSDKCVQECLAPILNESGILKSSVAALSSSEEGQLSPREAVDDITQDIPKKQQQGDTDTFHVVNAAPPSNGTTKKSLAPVSNKPPKNLPLFSALDTSNLDMTDSENRGLIAICGEIMSFSQSKRAWKDFRIAAVLLTRCLIEQTFVRFLKKMNCWDDMLCWDPKKEKLNTPRQEHTVTLGILIKFIDKNKDKLFNDKRVKEMFTYTFIDKREVNMMNQVVHQLTAYQMSPETLQSIVDEGLFKVLQYMIHQL